MCWRFSPAVSFAGRQIVIIRVFTPIPIQGSRWCRAIGVRWIWTLLYPLVLPCLAFQDVQSTSGYCKGQVGPNSEGKRTLQVSDWFAVDSLFGLNARATAKRKELSLPLRLCCSLKGESKCASVFVDRFVVPLDAFAMRDFSFSTGVCHMFGSLPSFNPGVRQNYPIPDISADDTPSLWTGRRNNKEARMYGLIWGASGPFVSSVVHFGAIFSGFAETFLSSNLSICDVRRNDGSYIWAVSLE